jgi:hypothetical protein
VRGLDVDARGDAERQPSATAAYVPAMITWFIALATCPAPLGPDVRDGAAEHVEHAPDPLERGSRRRRP